MCRYDIYDIIAIFSRLYKNVQFSECLLNLSPKTDKHIMKFLLDSVSERISESVIKWAILKIKYLRIHFISFLKFLKVVKILL